MVFVFIASLCLLCIGFGTYFCAILASSCILLIDGWVDEGWTVGWKYVKTVSGDPYVQDVKEVNGEHKALAVQ
jgi:hypothetical protein